MPGMISEITLAMVGGMGLAHSPTPIHRIPRQAEAIKKVADAYNRTRLPRREAPVFTLAVLDALNNASSHFFQKTRRVPCHHVGAQRNLTGMVHVRR